MEPIDEEQQLLRTRLKATHVVEPYNMTLYVIEVEPRHAAHYEDMLSSCKHLLVKSINPGDRVVAEIAMHVVPGEYVVFYVTQTTTREVEGVFRRCSWDCGLVLGYEGGTTVGRDLGELRFNQSPFVRIYRWFKDSGESYLPVVYSEIPSTQNHVGVKLGLVEVWHAANSKVATQLYESIDSLLDMEKTTLVPSANKTVDLLIGDDKEPYYVRSQTSIYRV